MVFLPDSLNGLSRLGREVGIDFKNSTLNLDAGFDSKRNRKCVFNHGLKPNIKENKRNRKKPKRGRKRFFDQELYDLRFVIERSFAWKDKFKRLLLRFECLSKLHAGFKLLAFTLVNLRDFCTA